MKYRHNGAVSGRWFFAVATWPFGFLEVGETRLRIGSRLGSLVTAFGIPDTVVVTKSDPVQVRQVGNGLGTGFFIVDQFEAAQSAMFNTWSGGQVRGHLEECGWPVGYAARPNWKPNRY
ncbi:MAG: hypothetical protein M9922_00320 [Microthrixaceae bacterium]|nr:hypothetical protein [Microthrixaceae bacterium]